MLTGGGARPPPISPRHGRSPRGEEAVHGRLTLVRSSAGPASLAPVRVVAGHLRPLHYVAPSGRLEAAAPSAAAPSPAVGSLPTFITESHRRRPSSASPATASHLPAPLQPSCPDGVHRGQGRQKAGRSRGSCGGARFCSPPPPPTERLQSHEYRGAPRSELFF
jgi:hypothetical protein